MVEHGNLASEDAAQRADCGALAAALDIDDATTLREDEVLPGEVAVEGVVTMHDCVGVDNVALVRFAQETNASTLLLGASSPRVRNFDYVVGKPVLADAVSWKPMSAPDGRRGHLFALEHEGRPSSRIEVFVGPQGRLERVAVVDASHSQLAAAWAWPTRRPCFEYAHRAHLSELRTLVQRMRADTRVGYVPVLELCVGEALEALPLACCGAEPTALAQAHAAWGSDAPVLARNVEPRLRERAPSRDDGADASGGDGGTGLAGRGVERLGCCLVAENRFSTLTHAPRL